MKFEINFDTFTWKFEKLITYVFKRTPISKFFIQVSGPVQAECLHGKVFTPLTEISPNSKEIPPTRLAK